MRAGRVQQVLIPSMDKYLSPIDAVDTNTLTSADVQNNRPIVSDEKQNMANVRDKMPTTCGYTFLNGLGLSRIIGSFS